MFGRVFLMGYGMWGADCVGFRGSGGPVVLRLLLQDSPMKTGRILSDIVSWRLPENK